MARPRSDDVERWTWKGVPGYVAPRPRPDGSTYAYMYYKSRRRSAGLPFNPEFKPIIRKLHVEYVKEMTLREHGFIEEGRESKQGPRLFSEALQGFLGANRQRLTDNAVTKLRQAVNATIPTDCPLDYDRLHEQVTRSMHEHDYTQEYWRKLLYQISRVLRFAVHSGWLDRNPIDAIGIPKQERRVDAPIYSREEIAELVGHFREDSTERAAPELAVLFEWLSLTAMRSAEAFSLAWGHVKADGFRVVHGKAKRERFFPMPDPKAITSPARREWQDRLRVLLDEMRILYQDHRPELLDSQTRQAWDEGQVFPWNRNASHPAQALKQAKMILGWPKDDRAVHTFRASAEDYWATELRLSPEVMAELAGHSVATYVKHYRKRWGGGQLSKMISE